MHFYWFLKALVWHKNILQFEIKHGENPYWEFTVVCRERWNNLVDTIKRRREWGQSLLRYLVPRNGHCLHAKLNLNEANRGGDSGGSMAVPVCCWEGRGHAGNRVKSALSKKSDVETITLQRGVTCCRQTLCTLSISQQKKVQWVATAIYGLSCLEWI